MPRARWPKRPAADRQPARACRPGGSRACRAACGAAPRPRSGLADGHRPRSNWMFRNWMRSAAAAASSLWLLAADGACTTACSRPAAAGVAMPRARPGPGGFSSAGAMRTPETLPGPNRKSPVKPKRETPKGNEKAGGSARARRLRAPGRAGRKPAANPAASR